MGNNRHFKRYFVVLCLRMYVWVKIGNTMPDTLQTLDLILINICFKIIIMIVCTRKITIAGIATKNFNERKFIEIFLIKNNIVVGHGRAHDRVCPVCALDSFDETQT